MIHLTPPVFDPVPIAARLDGSGAPGKMFADYDLVLARYGQWLVEQRTAKGWQVLDVHGAMTAALAEGRIGNPTFTFAGDGVHPNDAGHRVMALPLLRVWGVEAKAGETNGMSGEILKQVRIKQRTLKDAWLRETGHLRPGMAKGLPLAEAQEKAAETDRKARKFASSEASRVGK